MQHPALSVVPLLLTLGCATETEDAAPVLQDVEAYLAQEILISVADNGDGVATMELEQSFELQELNVNEAIGVNRYALPDRLTVKQAVAELELDPRVDFAEPNYIARIASVNDPYYGYQWNLQQLGIEQSWGYGTGHGITVAVLDTGVNTGGPDGIDTVLNGYDTYNNDSNPTDGNGHGTFVASTIAQSTNNGVGVAGVAPDVSILPVKVMSDQGYGDLSAIVNGITYATDAGAHVINMSLGSAQGTNSMKQACDYAHQNGVVLVAATGNEFASYLNYPAAFESVIAVGASRVDGTRSGYSNYGSGIGLLAPGGDLSKDQNGDGYADGVLQESFERGQWSYLFWEGTSMASPHVAATAALIMAQGVSDPAEVADILYTTAVDVASSGYDSSTGYGRLDTLAAVELAATGSYGDGGYDDGGYDDGGDSGDSGGSDGGDSGGDSGPDTTAPTISGADATVDGGNFTIFWTTDEPADSYVDFEGYGAYGDDELVNSHSLSFTGQVGSTYTLTLESTDAAGNKGKDGPYTLSL